MPSPRATPTRPRSFPVYDNMFYVGKPDTKKYGLISSNIIDEGHIWPHGQNYGVLPSRSAFDAIVAAHMANPGPIVLDIEKLAAKRLYRHHTSTLERAGNPRRLGPC
jgi:hypothetical protein